MLQLNPGQTPINRVRVEHTSLGKDNHIERSCKYVEAAVGCSISDSYSVENPIATATAAIMYRDASGVDSLHQRATKTWHMPASHFTCDPAYKPLESLQIWSTTQTLLKP